MLGRQKQRDGTPKTGQPLPPGHSNRPDAYRTDNSAVSSSSQPAGDILRRAPDVTAVTGRRTDVAPSAFSDAASKRLTVGRGITLSGEIRACDLLIVEGQVEATLSESRAVEISASGVFKGIADIEFRRGQRADRGRVGGSEHPGDPFDRPRSWQDQLRPDRDRPRRHHLGPDRRAARDGDPGRRTGHRSRDRGTAGGSPDGGRFFDPGTGGRKSRPKSLTTRRVPASTGTRPPSQYITIPPSATSVAPCT